MPTLQRCEVWSDFQCAGGSRLAVLPIDHVTRLTTTTRLTRDDQGLLELSKDTAAYSAVTDGAVIRLLHSDATFDEWRIREIEDASRSARIARLVLQSPLFDLNIGAAMITATVDTVVTPSVEYKALTPAAVVAALLAFAPSWWAAGTITPTIPVNLSTDGWMPLRAFRSLVDAIRAQGVECELDVRRNGTAGYYLDLVTAIGSSASAVDVRTAKNLLSTTRNRDRTKYATEVVPLGTGSPKATMASAWWECTAKSGTTLTMAQPVTGGAMLAFDDQLNTARYLVDDAGARQQITDCTAGATQQIVVASAANVTAGRWYRVVADSSGNELVALRKAAGTTGPIAQVSSATLGAVTNFCPNPAMRAWSGSVADNWTAGGAGTYTKVTTAGLWIYGGQSCLVQNATVGTASLTSPLAGCYIPSTWTGYLIASAWIRPKVYGDTGEFRLLLRGGAAGATGLANFDTIAVGTHPVDTWVRVDKAVALSAATRGFHIYNVQAFYHAQDVVTRGEFYVDSVQVVIVRTDSAPDFLEGSDAARLWSLANRYLTLYGTTPDGTTPAAYTITFADLQQWDPAGFPHDTVTLGATANVRDTDLGVTTSARIVEFTRDWKNTLASHITVANRPADLITTLTGIAA